MTLPNGADGLSSNIPFGITSGDGSLPGLVHRNQLNVSNTLKAGVQGSPGWLGASATMFAGLSPDGKTGPLLLLLQALGGVLAIPGELLGDVESAISAVGSFLQNIGLDLENVLRALLNILGLGWLLGSTGGTGGGSTGTGQDPTQLSQIDALQQFLGRLGTDEPISTSILAKIASTAAKNVLSNPNFNTSSGIQGQGLWCWDGWVGTGAWSGINSSVRTVRSGVVTIYNIVGTSQGQFLFGGEPINTGGSGIILEYLRDPDLSFLVDWALTGTDPTYTEWINVPYPAAQYPMGPSVQAGASWLMNQINQTPGPFIMIGDSQGCQVAAAVYDELRFGTMQARRDDLLAVIALGNLRREQGHTFPGYADPAPGTSGMCDVSLMTTGPYKGSGNYNNPKIGNLVQTENLWWDFCVAGDYYACCPIEGATVVPSADAIGGHVGDIPGIPGVQLRQFYTFINQAYGGGNTVISDVIKWGARFGLGGDLAILEEFLGPVMAQIGALGAITSPHNSYFTAKPWADRGDERTFVQVGLDYINSVVAQAVADGRVNPPVNGEERQLAGEWFAALPEQDIIASAMIMWTRVVCNGPAFFLTVNCYDVNKNFIAQVTADDAVVTAPEPDSSWNFIQLKAAFITAPGTAWACPVVVGTPEAMRTGILWADQFEFELTNTIDAAYLDVTNIPQLSGLKVQGPQGQADILTAFQNYIDHQASAATQTQMTGVQWAQALDVLESQAEKTNTAYQLGVYNHQIVTNPSPQPYWAAMQPTGQSTFALPNGATPTASIGTGSTLMGFLNVNPSIKVGFVEFMAKAASTPSGIYLNLYTMDPATGNMTNVYSSADISSSISTGALAWVPIGITTGKPDLALGQLIWWEIANTGGVALTVAAQGSSDKPNKTYMIPPNGGASRSTASTGGASPASLIPSQVTYGPVMLFMCMSVSDLPPTFYPPNQTPFNSPGIFDYTPPSYLAAGDFIDAVALGAGAGAGWADGTQFNVQYGQGGGPGEWAANTWVWGTDIPLATTLKLIIGNGGLQNGNGGDTILGYGLQTPAPSATGVSVSGHGTTLTSTLTATAGDYVIVALTTTWGTFDVTYNGVTMIPLGLVYNGGNPASGALGLWGLPNAPGGAKTIVANFAKTCYATMESASYSGISCAGLVQSVHGKTASPTQAVMCASNQMIVQAFAAANAQMSLFTGGTNRLSGANPAVKSGGKTLYRQGLSLSDSLTSATFAGTNNVVDFWGGIAVCLNPGLSTVLLHAAGGPAGGPGGKANYNPANSIANSTGGSPSPNPKVWAGRTYVGGPATTATHLPGNAPAGGAAGGDMTNNPLPGGDAASWLTARRGASSGGSVGGGTGIGGGGTELSVLFEAAGTGLENVGATSGTWSHTSNGGATCAVVLIGAVDYSGTGFANISATYGTSTSFNIVLDDIVYYNVSGTGLFLFALGLFGPPSGTQTITLSTAGSTATINDLAANTFSYQNVGNFGNWYHNSGHNTAPALPSITAETGQMVVAGFADISRVLSAFNKTQRWAQTVTASIPMIAGDAAGAGSGLVFSATAAATDYWGGVGGVLVPAS